MIDVATIPAHKQAWWRPVVVVGNDSFDPLTQKKTGPVTTIEASQVVDTYTIVALTAQEISDLKDTSLIVLNGGYSPLLKILRNHENRMRLLENAQFGTSKPPLSLAEVQAAIKALL